MTNTVDPEEGAVWEAMPVAMAAMFVAALAVPETFGRHGVVFGVAFLIVNVMHLALYALPLPMVAGIVLFAFALTSTLAHVGDELDTIPAVALCGGSALYRFGYVALRVRVARTVGRGRFIAAIACAALLPVAVSVPALVALALLAAIWFALHAYEIIWWR